MDIFSPGDIATKTIEGGVRTATESFWNIATKTTESIDFTSPPFPAAQSLPPPLFAFGPWKFLLSFLGIFFIILVAYVVYGLHKQKKQDKNVMKAYFIKPEKPERKEESRWTHVEKLFQSDNPTDWRQAIIEADIMLEDLFIRMGYEGSSLSERMKQANPQTFPMIQHAWQAHLVRNRIAHEGMRYQLTQADAWRIYKMYEGIFRSMRYL